MPKVKVEASSQANSKETFDKICNLLDTDEGLRKLDPTYKCEFNSDSLTGSAKGKMFKATMSVDDAGDGSTVNIEVDLPLALSLAKNAVKSTLEKKLSKVLS